MARQVLNEGLSLTEGVLDKGNLTDLMNVINRSDTNFAELYAGGGIPGGGSFDNTVAQIPNNPTTLQAAIVELKALFDSVLS